MENNNNLNNSAPTPNFVVPNSDLAQTPPAQMVPPQNPVPIEPLPSTTPITHNSMPKLVVLMLLPLMLLATGAVAFYYYRTHNTPEAIAKKMLANISSIKSAEYSIEISTSADLSSLLNPSADGQANNTPRQTNDIKVIINGKTDLKDDKNLQNNISIAVDAGTVPEFPEPLKLGLEIRSIGTLLFLSLTDIPNLGFFDPNTLKNRWVKIEGASESATALLDSQSINSQNLTSLLTEEKRKKLDLAIQNSSIFKWSDELTTETVNGTSAHRMKFKLDGAGIKSLVNDIWQITENTNAPASSMAAVEKFVKENELSEGELWIGKQDLLPYRMAINIVNSSGQDTQLNVKVLINVTKYNEPLNVEAPTESVPLEQMLEQVLGPIMQAFSPTAGQTPPAFPDGDDDGDELNNQQEFFYGTNPNLPDTDGDGYTDAQEVRNGYDPLGPGKMSESMPQ